MTPSYLMMLLGFILLLAIGLFLINTFGIDPLGFSDKYSRE